MTRPASTEAPKPAGPSGRVRASRPLALWATGSLLFVTTCALIPSLMDEYPATSSWLFTRRFVELWVLVGLVTWAFSALPLEAALDGIGRVRGLVLGALFLLLLATQLGALPSNVYPLKVWNMYSVPESRTSGTETYTQLRSVGEPGSAPEILAVQYAVPAQTPRPFGSVLNRLARQTEAGDPEATRVLTEVVTAVAQQLGVDGSRDIEVRYCTVSVERLEASTPCHTVLVVDPSGGAP